MFLAACGTQPPPTKTETVTVSQTQTVTVSAPAMQTPTATASAPAQPSAAFPGDPASERTVVSSQCKKEIAKELRDPQSAQFGDQEYIVFVRPDNQLNYTGDPPLAVRSYQLAGTVQGGRNGFGGMGDPFNYACYVFFDGSGQIIDGRTGR
jgi:hypothetical protein